MLRFLFLITLAVLVAGSSLNPQQLQSDSFHPSSTSFNETESPKLNWEDHEIIFSPEGRAVLPLLRKNSSDWSLSIVNETVDFLQSLKKPFYIVTVAGPAREGKSFFLNNLLQIEHSIDESEEEVLDFTDSETQETEDKSKAMVPLDSSLTQSNGTKEKKDDNLRKGFTVGHTVKGATQGVDVLLMDRGEYIMMFLDTEGSGSLEGGIDYDPKLISLSLAFSTTFVYNMLDKIERYRVHFLDTLVRLDNNFKKELNVSFPLPEIIWAIQSFGLKLTTNQSPKGYLRHAFANVDIPARLRESFETNATIFLMPQPKRGVDRTDLGTYPLEEMDPGYLDKLDEVRQVILQHTVTKTPMTASNFAQTLTKVVQRLNTVNSVGAELVWMMKHCNKVITSKNTKYTELILRSKDGKLYLSEFQEITKNDEQEVEEEGCDPRELRLEWARERVREAQAQHRVQFTNWAMAIFIGLGIWKKGFKWHSLIVVWPFAVRLWFGDFASAIPVRMVPNLSVLQSFAKVVDLLFVGLAERTVSFEIMWRANVSEVSPWLIFIPVLLLVMVLTMMNDEEVRRPSKRLNSKRKHE